MNDATSNVSAFDRSLFHLFAGSALTALLIYLLAPVIPALIISFLVYVILEPFHSKLCRKGMSKAKSASSILFIIFSIMITSILFGYESILSQLKSVYEQVNDFKEQLGILTHKLSEKLLELGMNIDLSALEGYTQSSAFSMDLESLQSGSSLVLSIASYFLLVPLILFFLLKDYRGIRNKTLGLLPNRFFELGWLIYYRVSTQLHRYFRGVLFQIIILSSVATLGFYFIGLESYLVFGILAGFLVVVPYAGFILAMLIPIIAVWSSNPNDLALMARIIIVVSIAYINDQVFVVPTVIANAVNLHPLMIILGIVLFGYYMGIFGMIIAVPFLATLKIITESLINGLQNISEESV